MRTPWAAGETCGRENLGGSPSLVAVEATNGRTGYAYARDLARPVPANPAEAVAWMNAPVVDVHIPVYEADGTTVIGEFPQPRSVAAPAVAGGSDLVAPFAPQASRRRDSLSRHLVTDGSSLFINGCYLTVI